MLTNLKKLFSASHTDGFEDAVKKINALEQKYEALQQKEIQDSIQKFKAETKSQEDLDKILPDVFAMVREAAKRTLKQRPFDVQLMGSAALHKGMIAEMATGEGKTLAASLAASLNALLGRGVHVVTVNDYLAKRDAVWMGQIYSYLGLTVGVIVHEESFLYDPYFTEEKIAQQSAQLGSFKVFNEFLRPVSRSEAYRADITYGTNHEFGFDYLRDHLIYSVFDAVQRDHYFAIVDEVDNILIDEARTPLIISGISQESGDIYSFFDTISRQFNADEDFTIDEKRRTVQVSDIGLEKLSKLLGYDPYKMGNMEAVHHLEEAMKANFLFERDKDYVVKNNQVIIVDQFTGRLMHGRRWSGGLHQAVEAKEHVSIQPETKTLASISLQNYFRKYKKLAGMTGTALTSAEEFSKVYGVEVVRIPTNKQSIRKDMPDSIYSTQNAKWKAVVNRIKAAHENKQPVLVGTLSIDNNEKLSQMLKEGGIPHQLLNAKNNETEGSIIAQAGKLGAVTVATNMAGRGVDIILGGNPQDIVEAAEIKKLGGLLVIGTERHESRRIDNQLRGRSGRQGDEGVTQFIISAEDDLIRRFSGDQMKNVMQRFKFPEDEAIEHKLITKVIDEAQAKVEGYNFDARKYVLEFDDVVNKQRDKIYHMRTELLLDHSDAEMFVNEAFDKFTAKGIEDKDNVIFTFNLAQAPKDENELRSIFYARVGKFKSDLKDKYQEFLKAIILQNLDHLWSEHLDWLEGIRESVQLRAQGQKDPLNEFKREVYVAFKNFEDLLYFQTLNLLSRVEVKFNAPATSIGRNDPCPCGSGKKWKKCGLLNTEEHQKLTAQKK